MPRPTVRDADPHPDGQARPPVLPSSFTERHHALGLLLALTVLVLVGVLTGTLLGRVPARLVVLALSLVGVSS